MFDAAWLLSFGLKHPPVFFLIMLIFIESPLFNFLPQCIMYLLLLMQNAGHYRVILFALAFCPFKWVSLIAACLFLILSWACLFSPRWKWEVLIPSLFPFSPLSRCCVAHLAVSQQLPRFSLIALFLLTAAMSTLLWIYHFIRLALSHPLSSLAPCRVSSPWRQNLNLKHSHSSRALNRQPLTSYEIVFLQAPNKSVKTSAT